MQHRIAALQHRLCEHDHDRVDGLVEVRHEISHVQIGLGHIDDDARPAFQDDSCIRRVVEDSFLFVRAETNIRHVLRYMTAT